MDNIFIYSIILLR